ncbi:uncharacterized protein V1518DRAFT_413158 [Limtongia smithiae]|uniref:uncharacterized protein n=1 Tax=Limtongia smithiae TaxID=1125753 RepID=UPI0034CF10DA
MWRRLPRTALHARLPLKVAACPVPRIYRFATTSSYHPPPRASPPSSRFRLWTTISLVAFASFSATLYLLLPGNPFPKDVAALIRLGLRAEYRGNKMQDDADARDDADGNLDPGAVAEYAHALDHYLAALDVAQRLDLTPTSDEYTGLQIKACEVLEKMRRNDDACKIYTDLLHAGMIWLLDDPRRVGFVPEHMMVRYMRVAVRVVELTYIMPPSPDPAYLRDRAHLLAFWIDTAQNRLPANYARVLHADLEPESDPPVPLGRLNISTSGLVGPYHPRAPFVRIQRDLEETLLLTRDFYATICVDAGRLGVAYQVKSENVSLMRRIGESPTRILRALVDIGSIYYYASEVADVDGDTELASKYVGLSCELLDDTISTIVSLRDSVEDRQYIPPEELEDLDVCQSIALYSLGVLNCKQRNYPAAMSLFAEARNRAMGIHFTELADKVKIEWRTMVANMRADEITDKDLLKEALAHTSILDITPKQ